MPNKQRVPSEIAPFNSYIRSTDDFLQAVIPPGPTTNFMRLGLTAATAADWHTKRGNWDDLYALYSNKDTRTKTVTDNVQTFIAGFKEFAAKPLTTIAASDNATNQDENVFNLVLVGNRKKPTHKTTPITDKCFATLVNMGGAVIKASFRSDHDTKRASLAPDADSVNLAWKIGDTPPKNDTDGTQKIIITKATFSHATGLDNIGKYLYLYVQWYNTKNPNLAGSWSTLYTILIGE